MKLKFEENSFTTSTTHFSSDSYELASTPIEANGKYRGYTIVDATSTSSSRSSYTTKQGISNAHEIDLRNNGVHKYAVSFLYCLSQSDKPPKPGNTGHSLAHTGQPRTKSVSEHVVGIQIAP